MTLRVLDTAPEDWFQQEVQGFSKRVIFKLQYDE